MVMKEQKKDQREKDKYGRQAKGNFASPNGEKQINGSGQIFIIHFLEIKSFLNLHKYISYPRGK